MRKIATERSFLITGAVRNNNIKKISLLTVITLILTSLSFIQASPANAEDVKSCGAGVSSSKVKLERCYVYSSYNVYDDGSVSEGMSYVEGILENTGSSPVRVTSMRLDYLDVNGRVLETDISSASDFFSYFTINATLKKGDKLPFSTVILHDSYLNSDNPPVKVNISFSAQGDKSHYRQWVQPLNVKTSCKPASTIKKSFCYTSFKFKNTSSKRKYITYWLVYFDKSGNVVGRWFESVSVNARSTKTITSKRAYYPMLPQYKQVRIWAYWIG
jgi:hypothetical protein